MRKTEADNYKKIQIWWLLRDIQNGQKSTTLTWGENRSEGSISVDVSLVGPDKYARLVYTQTDDTDSKKDFDYKVLIIETPCNFGGTRHWFICPLIKDGQPCGRRVGVIYKAGDWFGCRHCHELTYRSQNINRRDKNFPIFKAFEIGKKLEKLGDAKRYTYKGKLTKKFKKLQQLEEQSLTNLKKFVAM